MRRGPVRRDVKALKQRLRRDKVVDALRASEEREAFLLKLSDALRPLADPIEIQGVATRLLAEQLGATRAYYYEYDEEKESGVVHRDYVREGETSIAGIHRRSAFPTLIDMARNGRSFHASDFETSSEIGQAEKAALAALNIRAVIFTPLVKTGRLVAIFNVTQSAKREWTPTELLIVEETAERTWSAVERARAEAALRESEKRYRMLVDAMDAGVMIIERMPAGPDGLRNYRYVAMNPAAGTMFNKPDLTGKTVRECFPIEDEECYDAYDRVLETGEPMRFERESMPQNMVINMFLARVGDRAPYQVMVMMHNVTERARAALERNRAEEALRQSEQQLKEVDRRKDEFLAMLAHELRNPLAPIRTGLELIRLAGDTPGAVERVRMTMQRQVGHMVRLVDDLLDVSRITSGRIRLQRSPTTLTSIVESSIEANRSRLEAQRINLCVELPSKPIILDVDATRFVQILSNLLHNAIKFTRAAGTVRLEVQTPSPGDGFLRIVVSDSGIGISSAVLPHIFEMFTQGDVSIGSETGLGIGLALTRGLIEMHGGTIEAKSDGFNQGSAFTISLPMSLCTVEPPAPPLFEDISAASRRVVVIDDNHDSADMMALLVSELGSQTRVAYDGENGISEVLGFHPDVVLLDIGMPGIDGYETCRRIRARLGSGIVIAAMTGWGQEEDKMRAKAAGFDVHLTKPVDPDKLRRLLAASPSSHPPPSATPATFS